MGIFSILGFLFNPLQTKMVITPEPVTKIDKRNTVTSKKFDGDVMSANSEQSGSQIPDAWSTILTSLIIVTF